MNVRRTVLRSIPAALMAGVFAAGAMSPSVAQGVGANFGEYYGAIRAYELCNDVTFDQPAYSLLARAIDEQTRTDLTVGESLSTIEAAQTEVKALVNSQTCNSEPVQELLALFESELAPTLQ